MIDVYKIGLHWYDGIEDRNGGLFEYRIIEQELKNVCTDKRVLVIVNGKLCQGEEESLLSKIKLFDIVIFIATDIIAFSDNKNIINASNYLLHQSPIILNDFYYKPQLYSYLPEMFYKYVDARKIEHNGKLIFGGGVRDNENEILSYLKAVPSTAYLKRENEDTRLPYNKYLNELAKHSYSLIISRKQYQRIGWITPRYTECLALDTLPICDCTYDTFRHFKSIVVNNPEHLKTVIETFENNSSYYKSVLQQAKNEVYANVNTFKLIITKLTGGYTNADLR